jgi:hypothetical protein
MLPQDFVADLNKIVAGPKKLQGKRVLSMCLDYVYEHRAQMTHEQFQTCIKIIELAKDVD